jgi:hypothetical protein
LIDCIREVKAGSRLAVLSSGGQQFEPIPRRVSGDRLPPGAL